MSEESNPIVLLPYDFTEVSKYAIKHAVGIAKQFDYSITLLNIMDASTKMYMRLSNMPQKEIQFKLNETCSFIMQNSEIKVEPLYRKGDVSSIHDIIKELNVCFMVMGIDEPRSKSSPVMKLVGKSPRPVFVIQQKSDYKGYNKILFPLDDFPTSRQKAPHAARIAKVTGGVITIFSLNLTDPTEKHRHATRVEQVEAYFKKNDIKYNTEYAKGDKKNYGLELIEYGISNNFDLIVIMHRPPTIFAAVDDLDKKLIFNEAKIPVLCVNPRDLGVGGGLT